MRWMVIFHRNDVLGALCLVIMPFGEIEFTFALEYNGVVASNAFYTFWRVVLDLGVVNQLKSPIRHCYTPTGSNRQKKMKNCGKAT
jgi:hypothetical protein